MAIKCKKRFLFVVFQHGLELRTYRVKGFFVELHIDFIVMLFIYTSCVLKSKTVGKDTEFVIVYCLHAITYDTLLQEASN